MMKPEMPEYVSRGAMPRPPPLLKRWTNMWTWANALIRNETLDLALHLECRRLERDLVMTPELGARVGGKAPLEYAPMRAVIEKLRNDTDLLSLQRRLMLQLKAKMARSLADEHVQPEWGHKKEREIE